MEETAKFLYPEIEPYNSGFLPVSPLHSLYFEESGNPHGLPVLYLHAGPGGGTSPRDRRYFNPSRYRILIFNQRGAGKSTPEFSLQENTTWDLLEDIENLRKHLGIERWVVFGGSWGSTLALLYAETHPSRVLALVLRGILTLRPSELDWFFQEGASALFPDKWEDFLAPIPPEERGNLIQAYYKRLVGPDEAQRERCAMAWLTWEMSTAQLQVDPENLKALGTQYPPSSVVLRAHYFVNGGFLRSPTQILDNAHIIQEAGIPVTIVQGRYDMFCPVATAYELHKRLPQAEFYIVEGAGHSVKEVGILKQVVQACDKYSTFSK